MDNPNEVTFTVQDTSSPPINFKININQLIDDILNNIQNKLIDKNKSTFDAYLKIDNNTIIPLISLTSVESVTNYNPWSSKLIVFNETAEKFEEKELKDVPYLIFGVIELKTGSITPLPMFTNMIFFNEIVDHFNNASSSSAVEFLYKNYEHLFPFLAYDGIEGYEPHVKKSIPDEPKLPFDKLQYSNLKSIDIFQPSSSSSSSSSSSLVASSPSLVVHPSNSVVTSHVNSNNTNCVMLKSKKEVFKLQDCVEASE